jgi:hypothetical protein
VRGAERRGCAVSTELVSRPLKTATKPSEYSSSLTVTLCNGVIGEIGVRSKHSMNLCLTYILGALALLWLAVFRPCISLLSLLRGAARDCRCLPKDLLTWMDISAAIAISSTVSREISELLPEDILRL